jgi:hypothetical protein
MKAFVSALLVTLATNVAHADCSALFNDLMNYAQPPTIGNCAPDFNTLYLKMATNRSDDRYISYAEGYTTQKITGRIGRFPLIPSFGGALTQTFSDRSKGVFFSQCQAGQLCFPTMQNFSVAAADQLGVSFFDGSVTFTLKSWGNGTFSVNLACTPSGMMYGEQSGTFYTFSFQKTVYKNSCIK